MICAFLLQELINNTFKSRKTRISPKCLIDQITVLMKPLMNVKHETHCPAVTDTKRINLFSLNRYLNKLIYKDTEVNMSN